MERTPQPHSGAAPLQRGAFGQAPHGQRECVNCAYYHPERAKVCSVFGQLENRNKDCSIYHEDLTPVEERVRWY